MAASLSWRAEADLAHQCRWYLDNAGLEVAERYLAAFDARVRDLTAQPGLGRPRKFRAPELKGMRSIAVVAPFERHLVFYRAEETGPSIERVMHGARDLPRRLIEPPESFG